MALARIITRNSGDASELSHELRGRGFEVEVVAPGDETSTPADLVLRLEEVDAEEAFRQVEAIPENQDISVFVAPGTIAAGQRYQEIILAPPAPPVEIPPAPVLQAAPPPALAFPLDSEKNHEPPVFAQAGEEAPTLEAAPFVEEAPAFLDVNDEPAFAMADAKPVADAAPIAAANLIADAEPDEAIIQATAPQTPALPAPPPEALTQEVLTENAAQPEPLAHQESLPYYEAPQEPSHHPEPAVEAQPVLADSHDSPAELAPLAILASESLGSAETRALRQEPRQQPAHSLDFESHFAPVHDAPYQVPPAAQPPERPLSKSRIAASKKAGDAKFWKIAAAVAAVALLALGLGASYHRITPLPDAFAQPPVTNIPPGPFKKATASVARPAPQAVAARAAVPQAAAARSVAPTIKSQPAAAPVRTAHKPTPRKTTRKSHVSPGNDLVAEDTVVHYGTKPPPRPPAQAKTTVKHYSDLK